MYVFMILYLSVAAGCTPSSSVLARTLSDSPSGLAAPLLRVISSVSIEISWSQPTDPNGVITSYELYRNGELLYSGEYIISYHLLLLLLLLLLVKFSNKYRPWKFKETELKRHSHLSPNIISLWTRERTSRPKTGNNHAIAINSIKALSIIDNNATVHSWFCLASLDKL